MRIVPARRGGRNVRRKEAADRPADAGCAPGLVRRRAEEYRPFQGRSRLSKTRSPPRDGAELIQPSAHVANHSSWAVDCLSSGMAIYVAAATQPDSPARAF